MYIVIVGHTQKIELMWKRYISSTKSSTVTPLTKTKQSRKNERGLIDGLLTMDFFGNKASSNVTRNF